jgi:hypothetical protein
MSSIKLLLSVTIFFLFGFYSFPQDKSDTSSTHNKGENATESKECHNNDFDFDWEEEAMAFMLKGSPTMSLNYGQSQISHKNITSSFTDPNLLELRLGYTYIRNSKYSEDILKYRFNHLFLSNFYTDDNNDNSINDEIKTNMWRFGIGWSSGYGYDLGKFSITPYYSYSLAWSQVKFNDATLDSADKLIADRYNETFRFGTGSEVGVNFRFIPMLSLDVAYERSIIFERHLFMKWVGSGLIEAISQGLLDTFIGRIAKSSPAALPIINVLLKGALAYGLYELRQEKMNWPFPSAPPMSYDQWKVGVTFNF